jgi:hypothetical protein
MEDLTGKSTGSLITAAEWNQLPQEIQNVMVAFGEALTSGNLDQLGEAINMYAACSTFYVCSGSADDYDAVPVSGIQGPTAYKEGMIVRMRPNNNNTGASVVNVNTLGDKTIVDEAGSTLSADVLSTARDAYMRFDVVADKFFLSNGSSS